MSVPIRSRQLTITPFVDQGAVGDEVIAMIVEASFDPAIRAMNYLPHCLDEARARQYCTKSDGIVLRLDGEPVGVTVVRHAVQPGEGVAIPPGCVELDEWVLPPFRGQGILGKRGWPLITAWLAQRFERVISVTWSDNHAAQALLRSRGYKWLGRSLWSDSVMSGPCEVFLYELAQQRAAS